MLEQYLLRNNTIKQPVNQPESQSLKPVFFFFLKTVKAIEQFGAVIEELLLKHGKRIIGEHCVCIVLLGLC